MKTTKEKRDKERMKREKLSIRVIGKTPDKKKKGETGEFELFKKIAEDRSFTAGSQYEGMRYVIAKHIEKDGKETTKTIFLEELTPWNFDHTTPKSRGKDYKLDPKNIQIVSVAWHFWKTNGQILKVDYPN